MPPYAQDEQVSACLARRVQDAACHAGSDPRHQFDRDAAGFLRFNDRLEFIERGGLFLGAAGGNDQRQDAAFFRFDQGARQFQQGRRGGRVRQRHQHEPGVFGQVFFFRHSRSRFGDGCS
ncbi:MAG: hypothetical protein BroJett038_30920 [Chloroflexota bacterium]|nr:MAG: hypothetical protein BroJett038_30920 [Chloroflexota bacterium]